MQSRAVTQLPFPEKIKFLLVIEVKACVCYFLTNFCFSPNDSPTKTMKDVLKMFEFLYFHLPFFFSLSIIALELDPR